MIARTANRLFQLCCWCVGLIVVLFALYLAAGRVLAGSFASDQARVEKFLQDNGLTFVALDAIESEWQVYDPQFSISGLSYGDPDKPAIEIDQLTVKLDSLSSLLHRVAVLETVKVSGVRLTVRMDADGIWVEGLPRGNTAFNPDPILDLLPHIQFVQLEGVVIHFAATGTEFDIRSVAGEPWIIAGSGREKSISMPIYLDQGGRSSASDARVVNASENLIIGASNPAVALRGTYTGDVRHQDFAAELYFESNDLVLDGLLGDWVDEHLVSAGKLTTQAWLSLAQNKVDITAEANLSDVFAGTRFSQKNDTGNGEGEIRIFDAVSAKLRFQGESLYSGVLTIPAIELTDEDFGLSIGPLNAAVQLSDTEQWLVAGLDQLDVTHANRLIAHAASKQLLNPSQGRVMATVAPVGVLTDVRFQLDVDARAPKLVATLQDYSMQSYLGVPAVKGVNGFLALQKDRGYLDIDSDEFEMYFANMFSEPWPFDSGRGRVGFSLGEAGVSVNSGLIELKRGGLEAVGKVMLRLPSDRAQQTWGLTIGISDARLATAARYIPNTLPQDLSDWLNGAVGDGVGREAGLTFHGALFRGAPAVRKAHDLYFKVEETDISYHPDWPSISDVTATIHINNDFVQSRGVTGMVFDSNLTTADVFVPIPFGGKVDSVLVTGHAEGPLGDGLRILNETPLAVTTSNVAAQWSGTGKMGADLDINVPLGPRNHEAVAVTVDVQLADGTIEMRDFNLLVSELSGTVRYNDRAGLSSDGLTGELFDHAISGLIDTQVNGDSGEILLTVTGKVDADALYQWSDQILLSQADGVVGYTAELHVPYGGQRDELYIEAISDLKGMTLSLPPPLAKPDSESEHTFLYRQTFLDSGYRVELALDDRIESSLKIDDGIVKGGRLHFGQSAKGATTYDAIRITGNLPDLSLASWLDTTEALGKISDVSLEDEIAAAVASVELEVARFDAYSLILEDIDLLATRETGAWVAHLDNALLRGQVRVEDNDALPLVISLDRLKFESDESDEDPFADVSPIELGDVDFSTRQLLLGDEDYGSWSFKFRQTEGGANFEALTASTMGTRILDGSQATWRVTPEGFESAFIGEVQVDDLGETLTRFGLASSIEGEGLKLGIDTRWQGSPAMIDLLALDGSITIHEGNGRFVQADTGGALKLLGIFDFASIARRFRLDFSDVVEKGFEFTDISGSTLLNKGRIEIDDPIVITGTSGRFTMGGVVNMNTGSIDNDMVVTLPVGRTLPWYAAYSAIATGPLAGAGVIIAQKVFENQINQMSSAKYKIGGTVESPEIEFVSIFSDDVREAGETESDVPDGDNEVADPVEDRSEVSKSTDAPVKVEAKGRDGPEYGVETTSKGYSGIRGKHSGVVESAVTVIGVPAGV